MDENRMITAFTMNRMISLSESAAGLVLSNVAGPA